MTKKLTELFPVWIILASIAALISPNCFTWFSGGWITFGLMMIMLGMGMTLSAEDFARTLRGGKPVIIAVLLQYTIMPGLGWVISMVWGLPAPFAVGIVLVACCPGGTASNVVSYLARADVAASVCMTAASTLIAPVMTPFLTAWLAGSRIEVSLGGLFLSTAQVVLLPIAAGLLINRYAGRFVNRVQHFLPATAVFFIVMIVASIIGAGREAVLQHGMHLLGAVFTLHALGFLFGYLAARFLKAPEILARTISIEVGMQNSGLGVVLARKNFSDPSTAIPSAISSAMHSVIGSLCAAYWRHAPIQEGK